MGTTFPRVTLGRDLATAAPFLAMTDGSPVPAPLGPADPVAPSDQPVVTSPPTTSVEYTVDVATAPPPLAQAATYASSSITVTVSSHSVASAGPHTLPTTGAGHLGTLGAASAVLLVGVVATRLARGRRPVADPRARVSGV